jgi:hypothetical protein
MSEVHNYAGDGWRDIDANDPDQQDEHERKRFWTCEGREWAMEAKDPYGFWYIFCPGGGVVPQELSGAYTATGLAEDAVVQYMFHHPVSGPKIRMIEEGVEKAPPLKTKKVVQKKAPVTAPKKATKLDAANKELPNIDDVVMGRVEG